MKFDKPKVGINQIPEIILPYDLGRYKTSISLGGVPNTTFKVFTDNTTIALRVYSIGQSSLYHIGKEIEILEYLRTQHFPAPRPIKGVNGKILQYWGKYPILVTEYIEGKMAEDRELTPMLSYNIGSLLNKYRQVIKSFDHGDVPKSEHIISKSSEVVATLTTDLENRGWEMDVSSVKKQWEKSSTIVSKALNDLEQGIVHSDFWPPNLKINGDKIVALMDFDDWSYGPIFFDLVVAFQECAMFNSDEINHEAATNIFRGYFKTGGELSELEASLFPYAIQLFSSLFLAYNVVQADTYEEAHIYLRKLNRFKDDRSSNQFNTELSQIINTSKLI